MTYQLLLVFTSDKIIVRYWNERFEVEQEKQLPFHSLNLAIPALRNLLGKTNHCTGAYVALDLPAEYYRLKTSTQQTKEELARLWGLNEKYFGYLEYKKEEFLYCGLAYKKELIEPYLALCKKLKLTCLGILPLDLLYAQNNGSGIYALNNTSEIVCRIFYPGEGFYYQILHQVKPRAIENLLNYLQREKIITLPTTQILPNYPLEQAISLKEINPSINIYTEGQKHTHKKFHLSSSQKVILTIATSFLASLFIVFTYYYIHFSKIERDIRQYTEQLSTIAEKANALKEIEEKTKYLRNRLNSSSRSLTIFAETCAKQKLIIKELTYDHNKKLLSVILIDKNENHNNFIKALKESESFENINLIYLQQVGLYTELKLIMKVK